MGVTEIHQGSACIDSDLDKAILLAIKEMLPNELNPIYVEADTNPDPDRKSNILTNNLLKLPFPTDAIRCHPLTGYVEHVGMGINGLYHLLFPPQQDHSQVHGPYYETARDASKRLEDLLTLNSDSEIIRKEVHKFVQQTEMPLEYAEHIYKKVKGHGFNGLFSEEEEEMLSGYTNPYDACFITTDFLESRFMIAGFRPRCMNFFWSDLSRYDLIDPNILNAYFIKASETMIASLRKGFLLSFDLMHVYGHFGDVKFVNRSLFGVRDPTRRQQKKIEELQKTYQQLECESGTSKFGTKLFGDGIFEHGLLLNHQDDAIANLNFQSYAWVCKGLDKEVDFKVLDEMLDAAPALIEKSDIQMEERDYYIAHTISSIIFGLSIGYKNKKKVLETLHRIESMVQSEFMREFLPRRSLEIYSLLEHEEGLIAALATVFDRDDYRVKDYIEILDKNPQLRVDNSNQDLKKRILCETQARIESRDYYPAFLINRALGRTTSEFIVDVIRKYIQKDENGKENSFNLKAGQVHGESIEYRITVHEEKLPRGYASEDVIQYHITIESKKGKQHVVIKENKDVEMPEDKKAHKGSGQGVSISYIEAKLCNALGCFGNYVVMKHIPGRKAIDLMMSSQDTPEMLDAIIVSIEEEMRRINPVELSRDERTAIEYAQSFREENYKKALVRQLGQDGLADAIIEEMTRLSQQPSSSVLLKDTNPHNIIIDDDKKKGTAAKVTHFDYNYLNIGGFGQEYIVFIDSWGCADEQKRERFISRVFKLLSLDHEKQQEFHGHGFVENMLKYAAFVQRAEEEGLSEEQRTYRSMIAAFKFHRALLSYSRIDTKDELLFRRMEEFYTQRLHKDYNPAEHVSYLQHH